MSFKPITSKKKDENIGVYLRIRPLNDAEKRESESYAVSISPEGLKINADEIVGETSNIVEKHRDSKFVYDKLFAPDTTTDQIFKEHLESMLVSSLSGFNSTVFVYGQTGSGKTHTLMGQYKDFVNTRPEDKVRELKERKGRRVSAASNSKAK